MKSMTVSLQNQKKALQLKYLLTCPQSQQIQSQLTKCLNTLYPFSQSPLKSCPPVQLHQSHSSQQTTSTNLGQQLQSYSYIIVTGGLVLKKGQHQFIENRFLSLEESQEEVLFNISDAGILLKMLPNSMVIKLHNVWVQLSKKNRKKQIQDFIKEKLLNIGFFANLPFDQFRKCCKSAYIKVLGPNDILLKQGQVPYNMYIVVQGQLVFQRKIKFIKDKQLWSDVMNELQRQQDNTCQQMFTYLVKQPKPHQQTFQVSYTLKNISESEIICSKQTLCEQPLTYNIVSSLKTKLICIKYPDFYNINSDKLAEIRALPLFVKNNGQLRKYYYYYLIWQMFKEEVKNQAKVGKLEKYRFQDFLRSDVNLPKEKHYYCAHKVGEGNIIDSPASKVSKLKFMTYGQTDN